MRVVYLALIACLSGGTASAADGLYVCVRHYKGDGEDFDREFSRGPITVPAGTVFDFAGHTFGGAIDPKDDEHMRSSDSGWAGVTEAETARRHALRKSDMEAYRGNHAGVVVTSPITLTKRHLCALARAEAIVSPQWGWSVDVIFGDPGIYYQAYGVVRAGKLDTDFDVESDRDPNDAFELDASLGALNGVVQGTLSRHLTLQPDNE